MTTPTPKAPDPRRLNRLSLCIASTAAVLFAPMAGSAEAASHSGGSHGGGGGHLGGGGHFGGGRHGGGFRGGGYHGDYRGRGWGGGFYPGPAIAFGGPYYCARPLVWEIFGEGGQCY